ncbi:MAG: 4-vinyl reductase [Chloroflexota bacterium]
MEIKPKSQPDAVADLKIVDAYMRWALLAAEEVVGAKGMGVVLRDAKLERFVGNYPADVLKPGGTITFGEYASLNAGLLNFFGRAGKSMAYRVGRLSAKHGIDQQSAIFGVAALLAAKVLPYPMQIKVGLDAMNDGFRKVYGASNYTGRIEDRGATIAMIMPECANCAGKQSTEPMCLIHVGVLLESVHWLSGKEAEVKQTASRSMGAEACVWEVSKTPKE